MLLLALAGCANRSAPPPRDSPQPQPVGTLGGVLSVVDGLRAEPAWYDATAQRVFRFRNGVVEPVQDRTLSTLPVQVHEAQLRVFDDDSFALLSYGKLYVVPVDGDPVVEDLAALEVAIDGTSADDLWYVAWFVDETLDYRLCHRVSGHADCSVAVPNAGGFSAMMALGPDGSVYVTDRDVTLYRYAEGQLTAVGTFDNGIDRFRRGGSLFALSQRGLYLIDGTSVRHLENGVDDVIGTADDYYVELEDWESAKVNPTCHDTFFTTCDRVELWSQTVYEHVQGGRRTEIGYENHIGGPLGIDGHRLIILENPIGALDG